VYLGAWRTDDLLAIGGFDETLQANEDFDLCQRFRANHGTVWLEPGLAVQYEPRRGFGALGQQYFAFGRSKVRFWRRTRSRPNGRQLVALGLFATAGAAGIAMAPRARPRHWIVVAVACSMALFGLDEFGTRQPAPVRERLAASLAYVTVWGGWSAGIIRELIEPRMRP